MEFLLMPHIVAKCLGHHSREFAVSALALYIPEFGPSLVTAASHQLLVFAASRRLTTLLEAYRTTLRESLLAMILQGSSLRAAPKMSLLGGFRGIVLLTFASILSGHSVGLFGASRNRKRGYTPPKSEQVFSTGLAITYS